MQLLLETSADNQHYYCDSLKACLVTTVTSSGPSQSTIKLVATNMIANGKLAGEARFMGERVGAPGCRPAPGRGLAVGLPLSFLCVESWEVIARSLEGNCVI